MTYFPHLAAKELNQKIRTLLSNGSLIAHHADADGCVSACLISILGSGLSELRIPVRTQDFDFSRLAQILSESERENLITLDINVFSQAGAIENLAERVCGSALVIDDHLSFERSTPSNVEFIDILPPGERKTRRDQIRPTFMLMDELVQGAGQSRTGLHEILLIAASHAEGVAKLFPYEDIRRSNRVDKLARDLGRSMNAYYIMNEERLDDEKLTDKLLKFLDETKDKDTDAVYQALKVSQLFRDLQTAANDLSDRVARYARSPDLGSPWAVGSFGQIHMVKFCDEARLVNLVASELRNRIKRGVSIAVQEWGRSYAIELRRTKNLSMPNLVDVLNDIEKEHFFARGGHPMACGAAVKPGSIDTVLGEIRTRLQS